MALQLRRELTANGVHLVTVAGSVSLEAGDAVRQFESTLERLWAEPAGRWIFDLSSLEYVNMDPETPGDDLANLLVRTHYAVEEHKGRVLVVAPEPGCAREALVLMGLTVTLTIRRSLDEALRELQ
jgi:hypothetical protein